MKENINSHNRILSKIKLQEEMIWKPGRVIFDEDIFQFMFLKNIKIHQGKIPMKCTA